MENALVRSGITLPAEAGVLPVPRLRLSDRPRSRVRLCGVSFAPDGSTVSWGPVLEYDYADFCVTVQVSQEICHSRSGYSQMVPIEEAAGAEITVPAGDSGGSDALIDLWRRWDFVAASLESRGRAMQFLSVATGIRERKAYRGTRVILSLRIFDALGLGHRWVPEGELPAGNALPESRPELPPAR